MWINMLLEDMRTTFNFLQKVLPILGAKIRKT